MRSDIEIAQAATLKPISTIAEQLDISVRTVLNHRHNIAKKLQLQGTYSTMRLGLKLKSNTIS